MRALVALAVTLLVLIVAEPTVTATAPSQATSPASFAPVVLPMSDPRPPEAARLPAQSIGGEPALGAILDPGVVPVPSPPVRRQPYRGRGIAQREENP